ncbi:hypothetical protein [Azospirillum thiophilum]|uniref:Uncharacterized protein n=1 Tax=Azospirillum thiophilum TaxID=528244 RepID=A0AAC9EXT5_9PROT|nr:hypothetical protein [Azospirillum thiophilum]ALG72579.1 hypothetical protein AL072_16110 [Azospirillum thiophilum]
MSDQVLLAALLSYVAGAVTIAAVALILLLRRSVRLRHGMDRLTDELREMAHELREEIARRNGPEVQEDRVVLKEMSDHVKALRQTVAFSDQKLQDVRLQLRDLHADLKDRLAQSSYTLRRTLMDHERLIVELLAKAQPDHRPSDSRPSDGRPIAALDRGMTAAPAVSPQDGAEPAAEEPAAIPEPFRRSDPRRAEPT